VASDWHLVHLGKFAQGGAGSVMVEATAVTAEGRITHGDVGIWHDGQIAPLKRIAAFIKENGAVPAIQLAHAGRKASMQRPWFGNAALDDADRARGDLPWRTVAPSPIPMEEGWLKPHELSDADLKHLREQWRLATLRAAEAGFEFLELHCAHGYLLHAFLSPLSNLRTDGYGGDRAARMRYPLEILETVRAAWPEKLPLSVRVSSVDGIEGGIELADTIALAQQAKARGADVIDCSSGGLMGSATAARIPRGYGFQVPFAQEIRQQAGIATMAVGLILHPQQAEDVLVQGSADLIGIGREALFDPNWPLHARMALEVQSAEAFDGWPEQYGWWLQRREPGLRKLAGPALPFRKR
jgi:2,4-dienoyl-CoA reductase-like NADH-dependent reductase (Old Yellow Enzyme family)